ncbi:MAG: putative lipid II flippase FtsW [Clostridia bacterium]|nr:putative lipid II flippase FtsW [Clostridia bacterium]
MPTMSRQLLEREPPRERARRRPMDGPLLLMVFMLLATGLLALFTASYSNAIYYNDNGLYYVTRQGVFAVLGIVIMLFTSQINYHIYAKFQKPIFLVSLAMLAIVPFVGQTRKGATRWLGIGELISFQPSEIMKIAIIISFAYYIARDQKSIRTFKGLVKPYGLVLVLVAGLLFLEPHMSATMIMFLIGFVMLYVGGMRLWYFIPILIAAPVAIFGYVHIKPYAMQRILVWLDPWVDFRGDGWQGAMSAISIGSGGLWGLGLGQGRQKHLFLPEPQNDFIFSALSEELGFIGATLIMLMFAYLVFRGFYIARSSRDKFGCLLATGITAKLGIQTLMNLFVVSGIFPVTGASLPFFSYGGTALVMQLFEMGVLLNISRYLVAGSE